MYFPEHDLISLLFEKRWLIRFWKVKRYSWIAELPDILHVINPKMDSSLLPEGKMRK
jgi:hypothetical protein